VAHRSAGFAIATPAEWLPRPEELRLAPEAALEIGIPYTGQPVALPLLMGLVEREHVGPLNIREPLLRLQLEQGLPPGTTLGAPTHLEVAGAIDAVFFDAISPQIQRPPCWTLPYRRTALDGVSAAAEVRGPGVSHCLCPAAIARRRSWKWVPSGSPARLIRGRQVEFPKVLAQIGPPVRLRNTSSSVAAGKVRRWSARRPPLHPPAARCGSCSASSAAPAERDHGGGVPAHDHV
jgi:hypothetical protein